MRQSHQVGCGVLWYVRSEVVDVSDAAEQGRIAPFSIEDDLVEGTEDFDDLTRYVDTGFYVGRITTTGADITEGENGFECDTCCLETALAEDMVGEGGLARARDGHSGKVLSVNI